MATDSARNTAEANMAGARRLPVRAAPSVPAIPPRANAAVDAPVPATRAPPRAGPSSEPACTAAVDSAFPAPSCSPSSSDGMIAYDAGMNRPSPAPMNAAIGPSAPPAAPSARRLSPGLLGAEPREQVERDPHRQRPGRPAGRVQPDIRGHDLEHLLPQSLEFARRHIRGAERLARRGLPVGGILVPPGQVPGPVFFRRRPYVLHH